MLSVIVLGRPALFDGAFVDLKSRRFFRMLRTVRAVQWAVLAISSSVGPVPSCNLLLTMLWIKSWFESARFGAIVVKLLIVMSEDQVGSSSLHTFMADSG
jgi:hypothetical protein